MALNLPNRKAQQNKNSRPISMSRDRKKFSTMENARLSETKEGMPWCKGGF